jgi:hypothetical protein
VKAWQYRYLTQVGPWYDSWDVLRRVEAGKARRTAGVVSVFLWFSAEFCRETEVGAGRNGEFAG